MSKKKANLPISKPAQKQEGQEQIDNVLERFLTVRDKRLRRAFDVLPMAIVIVTTVFVFALWYSTGILNLPYTSTSLAIVVSVLITRDLFSRFPQTLLVIWHRRLLQTRAGDSPQVAVNEIDARFLEFVQESQRQLNSKLGIALGFVGLLVAFWLLWLLERERILRIPSNFAEDPVATGIVAIIRITYLAGGFVGGLVGWRVVGVARTITMLGQSFEINLQAQHPDNCGGLRPIGDLCLVIAYILSPLLLLVGGWLALINVIDLTHLRIEPSRLQYVVSTLQALVIPLALLSLVGFILPLVSIHRAMARAKLQLQDELNLIAQQIHQMNIDLRTKVDRLSAEEGELLEKRIDFLRRVYERNSRVPTWPISFSHVWRLAITQIAPIIGLGTSGLGLARSILMLFE